MTGETDPDLVALAQQVLTFTERVVADLTERIAVVEAENRRLVRKLLQASKTAPVDVTEDEL
jgi:hypothetical protein